MPRGVDLIRRLLARLQSLAERIRASPIGLRLARGFIWSTAGVVGARLGTLIAAVIVARVLGRADFGALGVVQGTVGMFQALAVYGLGVTASRFVAADRATNPGRAGRILALSSASALVTGIVTAIALMLAAEWLAASVLGVPGLASPLRLGAPLLLLAGVHGAQLGALAGLEAFRTSARVQLIGGLASLPLVVGGAVAWGVEGAVLGLVGATAVGCVVGDLAVRRESRRAGLTVTLRGAWQERRVLVGFTIPAILAAAMVAPTNWVCSALLVRQPGGLADMGVFSAANQWFGALLILPGTLSHVVLPVLSDHLAQGGNSSRVLTIAVRVNAAIVLPLALVGSLLSPVIMGMYGASFSDGWPVLVLALLTAAIVAVQTPLGEVIAASGRMWLGFAQNAVWALAFIGATVWLVTWGATGLAGARLAAYVVHAVGTIVLAGWLLRQRPARSWIRTSGSA